MKKIISILAGLGLGASVFATGSVGVNPAQNGILNLTNGLASITNTFAYPFQVAPVMFFYATATNQTPITNNFVTTTNFSISYPVNASTNGIVAWTAYVGGTRMQAGSIAFNSGTVTTNISFANAYYTAPNVVVTGGVLGNNTNAFPVVTAITATNFTLSAGETQTVQWMSVGTVANPASENTGLNPRNNTILY